MRLRRSRRRSIVSPRSGLPRKLTIDLDALERRYHELSRKIHPDRFASKGPKVRDASLRATATLTRSYRTLRDPVARGLYWLELNGEKLAENNKRVPPELAELVFEVQEQLAEMQLLRTPKRRTNAQPKSPRGASSFNSRWMKRWPSWIGISRNGISRRIEKMLTLELKTILSNIAYLRTLIRDVDRALENSKAA